MIASMKPWSNIRHSRAYWKRQPMKPCQNPNKKCPKKERLLSKLLKKSLKKR